MLIIEGCDLAGKTTLARECVKVLSGQHELPMMYGHLDKPPQRWDKYWDYRSLVCRHTVMDRFHMSHIAYRAVDGEPHDLTPLTYAMVDAEITLQGGMVVLVLPIHATLRERWERKNRDEMYGLEHVVRVNDVFWNMSGGKFGENYKMKVDKLVYPEDTMKSFDTVVKQICEQYASQQREHDRIHQRRPAGHGR